MAQVSKYRYLLNQYPETVQKEQFRIICHIEWQDKQGETQETKLSWTRAAGVVQRLVDEGRYLEAPVASLPEPETDEPLEGETEPYDYSFEYGLLSTFRLVHSEVRQYFHTY